MKIIRQIDKKLLTMFIVRGEGVDVEKYFNKEYPNHNVYILPNPNDKTLYQVVLKTTNR